VIGKKWGLRYALAGSLLGSLVAVGISVGAGTANACVTAGGTAVVDCDGMLQSDLSGGGPGEAIGNGGQVDSHGVEDSDGTQGDLCGGMAGSVPRCYSTSG
jgi:hypothetical protein